MSNFEKNIGDYICSGHALLNVDTCEKDRAISIIKYVADKLPEDRKIYVWSVAKGWTDDEDKEVKAYAPATPIQDQLQDILKFDEGVVCILKDFGGYLDSRTYPDYDAVISWLDELRQIISSARQTIIFIGAGFTAPQPLLHDITNVDFDLPTDTEIEERIDFICSNVTTEDGKDFQPNKEILPQIIKACKGMTSHQVGDRVSLALRKHKDLNNASIKTIVREKADIIRSSGLLEFIEPPEGGLDNVGGYEALKEHVLLDKPCFTEEARQFGIEFPKGILLIGISGCGKTLLSIAIASELNLPLIAMDVGNLMNKFVGESEANMREAIKMLERIAPCVLVLDEIEKGFGGAGDNDGGASRRIFGTFIKWMNDSKSPVYKIATANQVESLPVEFTRKGRFDEIYGLDLPNISEREEIFNIHLSKRDRDPTNFNVTELAALSEGYTGADIEQIVKLGLKIAFGKNKQLEPEHLIKATSDIVPLSRTEPIRIETTRKWCEQHAKPANPTEKTSPPKVKGRKIDLN